MAPQSRITVVLGHFSYSYSSCIARAARQWRRVKREDYEYAKQIFGGLILMPETHLCNLSRNPRKAGTAHAVSFVICMIE